jgi:hypothetical protein
MIPTLPTRDSPIRYEGKTTSVIVTMEKIAAATPLRPPTIVESFSNTPWSATARITAQRIKMRKGLRIVKHQKMSSPANARRRTTLNVSSKILSSDAVSDEWLTRPPSTRVRLREIEYLAEGPGLQAVRYGLVWFAGRHWPNTITIDASETSTAITVPALPRLLKSFSVIMRPPQRSMPATAVASWGGN